MSEAELTYECQVCYGRYGERVLVSVEKIQYRTGHRISPWHVCVNCAEKITEALLMKLEAIHGKMVKE